MKKIIITICVVSIFLITACKKENVGDENNTQQTDSKKIEAVQWFKRNQYVEFRNDGFVSAIQKTDGTGIGKHELRQLMIMWLALNYPDTLSYDELEREENIKADT